MADEIREKEVALDDAELEDVAGGKIIVRVEGVIVRVEGVIATGDEAITNRGVGEVINGDTGASFGGSGNVGSR